MKKILITFCWIIALTTANATIIHIPSDYSAIQTGIDSASNGDTVLVQPGIYYETIDFHGKNVVVASLFLTTNDTNYIPVTTLSPSLIPEAGGSIVTFENGETADAQLIGFNLTGGTGNYRKIGFDYVFYGGAIFCYNSSPRLMHLIISGNIAGCGGGILLYNSGSRVEYCRISNNVCNSISYTAPDAGGAIVCWNCTDAGIYNCKILNNTVSTAGAGIYVLNSKVSVINSLLAKNHSMGRGSAFYADTWSNLQITNCDIYGNRCDSGPGIVLTSMIYCIDSANVKINNSIFWNNKPATIVCQFNYSMSEITLSRSDIEGGTASVVTNGNATINWLNGNIDSFPQFIDTTLENYHLTNTSPCINTGDTTGLPDIPPFDLDHNKRVVGVIDMGCYESDFTAGIIQGKPEVDVISVFPNPTSNFIYVKRNTDYDGQIEFTLLNMTGKIIIKTRLLAGQMLTQLDVSHIAGGIYLLQSGDTYHLSQNKIVVHK